MYFLRSPNSNRVEQLDYLASKIEEKKQALSMSKDFGASQSDTRSNPIVSICIESDIDDQNETDKTKSQTPVTGKSIGSYSQSKIPRLQKISRNQADD